MHYVFIRTQIVPNLTSSRIAVNYKRTVVQPEGAEGTSAPLLSQVT